MAGAAAATCVTAASRGPVPLPWGGFCTGPCSIVLPWETISFYFCPFNSLTFVKHWLVVPFHLLPAWLLFPSSLHLQLPLLSFPQSGCLFFLPFPQRKIFLGKGQMLMSLGESTSGF